MLTAIQAGKVISILVALAYWLILCSLKTPWRSAVIEEVKALTEVLADLSDGQTTKPGQEEEQGCYGGRQGVPLRHPVDQTGQMR